MNLWRKTLAGLAGLLILGLVACSGREEPTPAPKATPVDVAEITSIVLEEVEAKLATREAERPAESPTPDPAAMIAETVRAEVEAYLDAVSSQPTIEAPEPLAEMIGAEFQDALIEVYRKANPAVVYILAEPIGSGTGFVFNEEGIVVTNNHVVEGADSYEIVFDNGERRRARLVGSDVDSDLAALQVEELPDGIRPLPLADSDELQVGQLVVAIGNPFGEQGSMTLGIISGLGRSLESQRVVGGGSSYSLPQVIQTDAPINPGNSGGPLLNLDGEVVGINSAIATATGTNSGVGFAIPVNAVKRITPSLIADGVYHYPYMGAGFANELSLSDQATFGLAQTRGAYVLSVTPGSPADEAGLLAANPNTGRGGDLIGEIDGRPINNFTDLNSYLSFNTSVGQVIEIKVLRDGEEVMLTLTLGERP